MSLEVKQNDNYLSLQSVLTPVRMSPVEFQSLYQRRRICEWKTPHKVLNCKLYTKVYQDVKYFSRGRIIPFKRLSWS